MRSRGIRYTQPVGLALSIVLLINWVPAFPDPTTVGRSTKLGKTSGGAISTTPPTLPRELPPGPGQPKAEEAFGKLPLHFEVNHGQANAAVKFIARGSDLNLFLLDSAEAVFRLGKSDSGLRNEKPVAGNPRPANVHSRSAKTNPQSEIRSPQSKRPQSTVRMKLAGANAAPTVKGIDQLPGRTNYFIGNDPAKWRTDVPTFGKVKYQEVYRGIDLVFYGNQRQMEYDLIVAPGADPTHIKLSFEGVKRVRVNAKGDLVLRAGGGGDLLMQRPLAYQVVKGVKKTVSSSYALTGKRGVGFRLAQYDHKLPLVIDPVISYSTYLGGIGNDFGNDIAVDASGNAYVTGSTDFSNFPTANPLQAVSKGSPDAFVTKFNAAGNALVYSTYFGGTSGESGRSIAVDAAGNAYLTGDTSSADFPIANPLQPTLNGSDAFVTKINPAGNALVYSTFLGGDSQDSGLAIAVDGAGSTFVAGRTNSRNFPTANTFQSGHGGGDFDAFVSKLSPSGSALVFSTYLGGVGTDEAFGLALDSSGSAYVTGRVFSANFPTANAFQPSRGDTGFGDAFVTKFNPAGNALVYSTFLGGGLTEEGGGIAVDSSGSAYVTGYTGSNNFPTANAFQATNGNPNIFNDPDAFVTKLNAAGNTLAYSTYLGGSDRDFGVGIAVDGAGSAFVTGRTLSTNFPLQDPLAGTGPGNLRSAFATRFNANGQSLAYSSYLGAPNGISEGYSIAVDAAGTAYVTGIAQTNNFPTVNPFQAAFAGNVDAFVMKIGATITGPGGTLSITPNRGGDTGIVSVTLGLSSGASFQQGATVKLSRTGQPDIVASSLSIGNEGRTLGGQLDLQGSAVGQWDVVVTNPDNTSTRISQGFTIEAGRAPELWSEILGRSQIRQARKQTYSVAYGNRGNIDAFAVPLIISFPKYLKFEKLFNVITVQPPDLPPIDYSKVALTTEVADETVLALIVPVISPNTTGFVNFSLELPADPVFLGTQFNIAASIEKPLLTLATGSTSGNPFFGKTLSSQGSSRTFFFDDDCFFKIFLNALQLENLGRSDGDDALMQACARKAADAIASGLEGSTIPLAVGFFGFPHQAHLARVLTCKCMLSTFCDNDEERVKRLENRINFEILFCIKDFSKQCPAPRQSTSAKHDLGPSSSAIHKPGDSALTGSPTLICLPVDGVGSSDPNDKVGARGVDTPRFISGERPFPYAVYFENKETATAPAQDVIISDQLDVSRFDFSTFSFGPIAFGDKVVTPPPNLSEFKTDVDLRPTNNLIVRIDAKLDKNTGALTWTFVSLDPATGLPTDDPSAGFLPPNKKPPEGDGHVLFTVKPKQELVTGTEVRNFARIVFDVNAPIDTPQWLNTIDNSAPVSIVAPLAAQLSTHSFEVRWSGTDTGSGLRDFTIFVSENGGPFSEWLSETSATSAIFYGRASTAYAFRSIARDLTGNRETKTSSDTVTLTPAGNPIDEARWFVRQHYLDFLNREPDAPGLAFWTDNINKCNDPNRRPSGQTVAECLDQQRDTTSAAFFLSPEFQYTGAYIYCVHQGSLGRMPTFAEFMQDIQQVARGIIIADQVSASTIENNRAAYLAEFVQRAEFVSIYGSRNNQAYVDKVFMTTGTNVSSADKQALVAGLNSGSETRATVLHKVVNGTRVLAEGQVQIVAPYGKAFCDSQFNPSFVQMEYFGYLRRDEDTPGFNHWLDKLNFYGDFLKAEMVRSFLLSPEYRSRFASP